MKSKKIFLLLLLSIFAYADSKAQPGQWLLGGTIYNLGGTSGPAAGTVGSFAGALYTGSDHVIATLGTDSYYDLFFIVDDQVYNGCGIYQFTLPEYKWMITGDYCVDGSQSDGTSGELAIVKVPGTPSTLADPGSYYVIYEQDYNPGTGSPELVYVKIAVTPPAGGLVNCGAGDAYTPVLGGLVTQTCPGTATSSTNPVRVAGAATLQRSTLGFTISKPFDAAGDCYLYVCSQNQNADGTGYLGSCIDRYTITSAGIGNRLQIATTTTISGNALSDCDYATHCLRLSPDEHFLAWTDDQSGYSCGGTNYPIWVLPLLNDNNYAGSSFTPEIFKINSTSQIGGIAFSSDSRNLFFTNDNGINQATFTDADPIGMGSVSTIAATTSFNESFLSVYGNLLYGIDASSNTLMYFDLSAGGTAPVSTSITVRSNNSNNYNSTYRLPKTQYSYQQVNAHVDVNSKCIPGASSPAVSPTFSVTVTDPSDVTNIYPSSDYYYNWYPMPGNNTTLDDYHSATPQITSATSPYVAYYYLTVTDKSSGGVYTQFVKLHMTNESRYDLASRDSYFDMYDEANSQEVVTGNWNIWLSPDIWNRYHENGDLASNQVNQHPEHDPAGDPNFLYVKVRNVGCSSYSTGATLKTYWTAGGGPETWSLTPGANYWTDRMFTNYLVHSTANGLAISAMSIPALAPGETTVLHSSWTPPNALDYDPSAATELCFLSRIVDGETTNVDGMRIPEVYTGTISANVRNNNNIVTLNSSIVNVSVLDLKHHLVWIGSGETSPANFSIQFANNASLTPVKGSSSLSQYMNLKVYLGSLFDLWVNNGAHGTYTQGSINYSEKSVVFDGTNTLQLDSIVLDTASQYPITFGAVLLNGADGSKMPNETFHIRQLLNGSDVYSGYSFKVLYQPPTPGPKGVLAVTEVSNGPSGDCEYAELIAANCSDDTSSSVDIRGWIIDDNSGNFNTSGCSTSVGIATGHYRLAFDDIWSSVPVGSILVVYNHDANCYNLSDTFRVDTTVSGLVYWIPIGGTVTSPYGHPHVERFGSRPSSSVCSYCADSGATTYAIASSWSNTIGLNNTADAFQVRCPGCNSTYSGAPEFYHGIGYGPATGANAFASIAPGTQNLGGPVINGSGGGFKYVFTGSSKADLGNPSHWSKVTAEAAGAVPSTLGNVTTAFMDSVTGHVLNLPCCGHTLDLRKALTSNVPAISDIRVYPNPANTTVNFEFPLSGKTVIKLFNISGSLIEEQVVNNNTSAIFSVSNYAPGLYIYQVVSNEQTKSGKIIVE